MTAANSTDCENDDGIGRSSQVDYSANNFNRARAAIENAAAQQQQKKWPPNRLRRVQQIGDTTVITEHQDPYSFYWQLDKLRRAEEREPVRPVPPADYVLEEEEEEIEEVEEQEEVLVREGQQDQWPQQQQQQFLSPDSGVHLMERERVEKEVADAEQQTYARPAKIQTEDPAVFSHYWHVDSGPRQPRPPVPKKKTMPPAAPPQQQPVIEEHAFRQITTKKRVELAQEESEQQQQAIGDGCINNSRQKPVRFSVRFLGQLEISETELEGVERSQTALNKAMTELGSASSGRNGGQEMWLELGGDADQAELTLVDAETGTLVAKEPMERIRCWAVGRDNPREFAYVVRKQPTDGTKKSRFVCHVVRCRECPASEVAAALGRACDNLLLRIHRQRPDSLPAGGRRRRKAHESTTTVPVSPIEEPKRVIRCHFIGVTQVPRATGVEVLNEAVDRLIKEVRRESWTLVDVHISPSAIAIFEAHSQQRQIASCRVRYLSFLGIGRDIKHCAFIVAQSADHFVCYIFHVDPSAGTLAKTIEAACKLRYAKVLDAHLGMANGSASRID